MAKSILIINEDEEEIKELQNFFAAEGSTVFCVKTVDDAIACFANNDLCLINTMELCLCPICAGTYYNTPGYRVRRSEPNQKKISVHIAMSGTAMTI